MRFINCPTMKVKTRIGTFACVCCLWIVISLWEFRSRGYKESQIFPRIKRNGTNKGVTDIPGLCQIPERLALSLQNIAMRRKYRHPSRGVFNVDLDDAESDIIDEFSIKKPLTRYPENGTGTTVNISEKFDPEVFNSFCDTTTSLKAVLPVFSTADRFAGRHRLRNSLGRLAISLSCKLFFIIGMSSDDDVNALLKEEYTSERDILVIDKLDTYRDLNNKAFAMIKWISTYCSHVPHVIHLIDDTYINLHWFLKRLNYFKEGSMVSGHIANSTSVIFKQIPDDEYMIAPMAFSQAIRTEEPKSFVTVDEYKYDLFPPYAYGFVYAFPASAARRLLAVAHKATYCWIEDVWIGGHVRIDAGIKLIPVPFGFWGQWKAPLPRIQWPVYAPMKMVVFHGVNDELLCHWYNRAIKD